MDDAIKILLFLRIGMAAGPDPLSLLHQPFTNASESVSVWALLILGGADAIHPPALATAPLDSGQWVQREQQQVIDYLLTENAALKEKIGKKRILLSDDQRRCLAAKGKVLGRERLQEISTLFTPDTWLISRVSAASGHD